MSIVINPTVPLVAAQGVTATVVLQPGTVVAARVLQILGNDMVQIAIGGQSIDVLSQVPLQAGQTLQLAVSQGSDGSVRLAVVNAQGGASASQGPTGPANATATSDSVTLAPGATAGIAAPITSAVVVSSNQLTLLEALAVSVAAQTAATQQTSLAPLFANLGVAAGLTGLPPQVQQAVAQLLAQRTSLDPGLTGDDIKQAFQNSGLFLEASLATGSVSASGSTPDLKAALIVLRQVLTTSLNGATLAPSTAAPAAALAQQGTTPAAVIEQGTQPPIQGSPQPVMITVGPETPATASPGLVPLLAAELAASEVLLQGATSPMPQGVPGLGAANAVILSASTPADAAARSVASSAALNLLQEALQAGPLAAGNPSRLLFDDGLMLSLLPAVAGARILKVDDAEFARTNVPPPPISGALPAAQPVMPATLVSNSPLEAAMHHLLADTDGAIARQTLLQVASLPGQTDTTAARLDPTAPRWNFEIPFATRQGTAMAQFEISRDGGGSEVEAAKRVWRARFSLDVEPAGPIHAQISLNGDRTSVRMWAERPATADQLRAGVSQLSQALSRAELLPGDIVIRDGAPVQSASAPAGHFLDRAL
jgi:Flagellar hook-length control protein FliK